ncbi:hypothetical protein DIPPA_26704 [Diplonema papillatum]|nr:hypothetical protein DIPPA_26704 [Diplonema papillatum]|eukprot:gene5556-8459_t
MGCCGSAGLVDSQNGAPPTKAKKQLDYGIDSSRQKSGAKGAKVDNVSIPSLTRNTSERPTQATPSSGSDLNEDSADNNNINNNNVNEPFSDKREGAAGLTVPPNAPDAMLTARPQASAAGLSVGDEGCMRLGSSLRQSVPQLGDNKRNEGSTTAGDDLDAVGYLLQQATQAVEAANDLQNDEEVLLYDLRSMTETELEDDLSIVYRLNGRKSGSNNNSKNNNSAKSRSPVVPIAPPSLGSGKPAAPVVQPSPPSPLLPSVDLLAHDDSQRQAQKVRPKRTPCTPPPRFPDGFIP